MRRLIFALLWLLAAGPLAAQDATQPGPAMLVADRVELTGTDTLVAEGNVEALYGDTRLRAKRITYIRSEDRLVLEGPITLSEGDAIVILADGGALDASLRNGLLRGARLVMDQRVQLAANRIDRVGGRYTQLYKVAATSCRVCNSDTPPIWQIRARRAVHDQQERQIYFENAQLRVLDVPIFWVPRLRLPDPTLKRATGFLIPSFRQRSQLGFGIKVPYFIRLGDHRDLTLTPYITTNTRTLEWRYRQAFRTGDIAFNGAFSNDDIADGRRGYLFANGAFDLPRDFKLTFGIEATSDRGYLTDYGYSDKDRLASSIEVSRVRRDEYIGARLIGYRTLRENENNSQIPSIISDLTYERRLAPRYLGGELRLAMGVHGHHRYSEQDVLGRDVARVNADLSWRRIWTLPMGLRAGLETGFAADGFSIRQDSTADRNSAEFTPRAGVTLRWPLIKRDNDGTTQILEPLLMLGWVGGKDPNVPNDESTRVEFDEGNLLSLSRFPAADRRERGWSAAYGLNWTRYAPTGWNTSLSVGQVIREEADNDFTRSSGLTGTYSNVLMAGQVRNAQGLSLTARALFDNRLDLTKAEARGAWVRPDMAFGVSYVWLGADAQENRADTVSEWSVDGSYRFSRHWTGTANWRYDLPSSRTAEAGLGLTYRNECVEVALSLSRRFTSSTIVEPSTDVGVTVGLRGFSAQGFDNSYTRTCRN